MSIGGIGAAGGPLQWHGTKRMQAAAAERNDTGYKARYAEQLKKVQNQGITLHISNETDGEAIGAMADYGSSVTVYRTKDFDPANPVYKVKIWDAEGNVTERRVDISKVDPGNCDMIDMFAYSSHLSASGECPNAQSAFIGSKPDYNGNSGGNLFTKVNWPEAVRNMMQMQYNAGNLEGYMHYKSFWDFLKK